MQLKNNPNVVWGVLLLMFGGFMLSEALKMPFRADVVLAVRGYFFPIILSCILMALSILLIFDKKIVCGKTLSQHGLKQLATIIAGTACYILLLSTTGFLVAAFLYVALCARTFGETNLPRTAIVSALMSASIYLVFAVWLKVRFPVGIIEQFFR